MANEQDRRTGLALTSRSIHRNGKPWIPVTGEIHYSRVPRHRWADALRLMKAGGITVVATYVFWIHHQEHEQSAPRFDDNLDLAAFIGLCDELGLEVILRLGPWCHGEVRNGGHPDWVANAGYTPRTNDPEYLKVVRTWFGYIGSEVGALCGARGPVIGIQIENELYDQSDHILELKRIAREAGLFAPLWTATAWGSADIPVGEVFPLYGGYSDGFWVDTDQGWDDSFRAHFQFSHQWDDPGIGRDLAGDSWTGTVGMKHQDFPAATCELGGGMASAYHRRPAPTARDVAAVAHCKLGSGSTWQGYYMYVGGTNPRGALQESHASGYPNDMPELNYDFGAPLGSHLQIRESFHRLRNQHSFLAAFGDRLAGMNSTLPENDDQLRWALRSDGQSGFLFINNHQPFEQLPSRYGIQFKIGLDCGSVLLPHRPIDLPSGEFLAWPLRLEVGGVVVNWATLNLLTVLEPVGEPPVLVLYTNDGVDAHVAVPAGYSASGHPAMQVNGELVLEAVDTTVGVITIRNDDGAALRLLVLDASQALQAWTPTVDGAQQLVLSGAAIIEENGELSSIASGRANAAVYRPSSGFSHQQISHEEGETEISIVQTSAASEPPVPVITVPGRASAPAPATFARHAAHFTITVNGPARAGAKSLLRLNLIGDTATARFGERQEDVFWDGSVWDIDITPAEDTDVRIIEVSVFPLQASMPTRLPDAAQRIMKALTGPTANIVNAAVITFQTSKLART